MKDLRKLSAWFLGLEFIFEEVGSPSGRACTKLIMWNKSTVNTLEETTLKITNPKNEEETVFDFIVVPNNYSCLLGLSTIQQIGLLTINDGNFITHISTDANQLGSFGETQLHVDPNVPPRALPCRKLPLALQENVKEELNHLVEAGVLLFLMFLTHRMELLEGWKIRLAHRAFDPVTFKTVLDNTPNFGDYMITETLIVKDYTLNSYMLSTITFQIQTALEKDSISSYIQSTTFVHVDLQKT
ncbi:Hypothetical predicted protein, partial [Paramuricea clavata]